MGLKEEHAVTVPNSIKPPMAPLEKTIGGACPLPAVQDKGCSLILDAKIVATTRGPRKMVKNADLTPAVVDNT